MLDTARIQLSQQKNLNSKIKLKDDKKWRKIDMFDTIKSVQPRTLQIKLQLHKNWWGLARYPCVRHVAAATLLSAAEDH